jgi:hypothetical protein
MEMGLIRGVVVQNIAQGALVHVRAGDLAIMLADEEHAVVAVAGRMLRQDEEVSLVPLDTTALIQEGIGAEVPGAYRISKRPIQDNPQA